MYFYAQRRLNEKWVSIRAAFPNDLDEAFAQFEKMVSGDSEIRLMQEDDDQKEMVAHYSDGRMKVTFYRSQKEVDDLIKASKNFMQSLFNRLQEDNKLDN